MTRFKFRICACACTALGLIFLGCTTQGGSSGVNNPTIILEQSGNYSVSGSNIIMSYPQDIYTYRYCSGDSLVTYSDTNPAGSDTMPFILSGSSLKLEHGRDSGYTDPAAIVVFWMVFTRAGSGSGLEGTWASPVYSYEVVAGTLTTAEQDSLDQDLLDMGFSEGGSIQVVLKNSTFSVYFSECNADFFIEEWNYSSGTSSSDSAMYNITVTKLSCNSVKLTGNVTNEQVTITWNAAGDATYTSTNAQHAAYTYKENPTTCPNSYEPDWYYDFEDANLRIGIPKIRAPRNIAPNAIQGVFLMKLRSLSVHTGE